MSSAPKEKMAWLRRNYEKVLVILMLIILLCSAAALFMKLQKTRSDLVAATWERQSTATEDASPVDLEAYKEAVDLAQRPPALATNVQDMLVSELRVLSINQENRLLPIPYYATNCTWTFHPQPTVVDWRDRDTDGDGMKNGFESDYGFDPMNPLDGDLDLDGDGFSNLEESQGETDPSDPYVYPALPRKLRVVKVKRVPFVLRFQGIQDLGGGEQRFLLNLRSLRRSYFATVGDVVEGFEVIQFKPEAPDGPTLTLKSGDQYYHLVKGVKYDKFEVVAGLIFLLDRSTYAVRVGDSLKLKERSYIIVDINRRGVVIRDEETGKDYAVGALTDRERRRLRGEPEETGRDLDGSERGRNEGGLATENTFPHPLMSR